MFNKHKNIKNLQLIFTTFVYMTVRYMNKIELKHILQSK